MNQQQSPEQLKVHADTRPVLLLPSDKTGDVRRLVVYGDQIRQVLSADEYAKFIKTQPEKQIFQN